MTSVLCLGTDKGISKEGTDSKFCGYRLVDMDKWRYISGCIGYRSGSINPYLTNIIDLPIVTRGFWIDFKILFIFNENPLSKHNSP